MRGRASYINVNLVQSGGFPFPSISIVQVFMGPRTKGSKQAVLKKLSSEPWLTSSYTGLARNQAAMFAFLVSQCSEPEYKAVAPDACNRSLLLPS
jgi:hypothetical protein